MLEQAGRPLTRAEAVAQFNALPCKPFSAAETQQMEGVVKDNRWRNRWPLADLS